MNERQADGVFFWFVGLLAVATLLVVGYTQDEQDPPTKTTTDQEAE